MRLLKILYSSIRNTSNIYRSIVGNKVVTNISSNNNSEFYKKNWSISKMFYLYTDIFIPTLPFYCPSWMPNIIRKTIFGCNSVLIEDKEIEPPDNSHEYFLFINGILTNETILEQNIKLLRNIFNRPINCVFNKTDSFIMDIIECVIGKETDDLTDASFITLSTISTILLNKDIKKLVIICHSQGTIIVSQVLRNLEKFGLNKEEYIKKIEIYAFANCSSNMKYIMNEYPYMEHFANENDLVAKMGCNCADDIKDLINIDGKVYINKNSYGHMFNSHYMGNFKIDYPESRLNSYI